MSAQLKELVADELARPVDPRVAAMAAAVAARHGDASRAVLFYGSCLRQSELDGLMLDFYLIVSDYRAAYGKSWLARANALVPPNVFPFHHDGLAAKYAVLSEADFHRLNGPETRNVSVWARFAPFIRTFVPIVAGAVQMEYRRFFLFNVLGGNRTGKSITYRVGDELEVMPVDVLIGHHFTSTYPGSHFTTGLVLGSYLPDGHVTRHTSRCPSGTGPAQGAGSSLARAAAAGSLAACSSAAVGAAALSSGPASSASST